MIANRMQRFPISMVAENFEISLTHAIAVSMTNSASPGVHGPTYRSNNVCSKLTHVCVRKAQKEIVKENWLAAIMKSRTTFARLPKTFKAMREKDLRPRCCPTSTSLLAAAY